MYELYCFLYVFEFNKKAIDRTLNEFMKKLTSALLEIWNIFDEMYNSDEYTSEK